MDDKKQDEYDDGEISCYNGMYGAPFASLVDLDIHAWIEELNSEPTDIRSIRAWIKELNKKYEEGEPNGED